MDYIELIDRLKAAGARFTHGLSPNEFDQIEHRYGFQFPPDYKEFLSIAMPISDKFINWRDNSEHNIAQIHSRMNWCLEGLLLDVEQNKFWYYEWGSKPSNVEEAKAKCEAEYHKAPKLIPIYAHRYIPETPAEAGNPILSVYQTDIIYYGENLYAYLMVEFGLKSYDEIDYDSIKPIRFWSDIMDMWEADYQI
ncbi:hypothetical protein DFQ01_106179 [Paenibacillus cellulosilyticus]|uniref:SMI1/KNR4 family protein SUKH-1 n=1 Tax=Paenibacillus cellulosilyticus TaxID=375489 RepID=A0A2V2YW86_9BACL|nr:SMI1/KNR4 family protein [Paenibacillus cellulosilyticus]PWW04894.1 hypothetical protein DFQ01_106179 [Paenibacillus cellulosilyticus]QKS45999.1 SMI1/KNR4 family protein [Paenibacillus cellulosilyticus]